MTFSKLNYINIGECVTYQPTGNYSTSPQDIEKLSSYIKDHVDHLEEEM
jgi:hypothetical protein